MTRLLSREDIQAALQTAPIYAELAEKVTATVDGIPDLLARERQALLAALDQRAEMGMGMMKHYRDAIAETTVLVSRIEQLVARGQMVLADTHVQSLLTSNSSGEERPFGPHDLQELIGSINTTLERTDTLLQRSHSMMESNVVREHMAEVGTGVQTGPWTY